MRNFHERNKSPPSHYHIVAHTPEHQIVSCDVRHSWRDSRTTFDEGEVQRAVDEISLFPPHCTETVRNVVSKLKAAITSAFASQGEFPFEIFVVGRWLLKTPQFSDEIDLLLLTNETDYTSVETRIVQNLGQSSEFRYFDPKEDGHHFMPTDMFIHDTDYSVPQIHLRILTLPWSIEMDE